MALPRSTTSLIDASVTDLAALIRTRAVSPVEVVEAHIARIERVNPAINALVDRRYAAARREARAAEAAALDTPSNELPPLHGVPCTIKEFLATEGMSWTAGLTRRRGVRATVDAEVVKRVRAAGAIVLGVTNIPEGGLWMETHNLVYGRTNNPWDLTRTPGGSSGGEAALIAAGGSPFGIGSDIGGSIRTPAAFCGVAGHKPSGRLVPNTGYWPHVTGQLSAFLVNGPLGRRVGDLWEVLKVIAGPDGRDEVVRPFALGDPAAVDLKRVVVYPIETNGRTRIGPEARAAVARATSVLRARGAEIRELRHPHFAHGLEIWAAMLAESPSASYAEVLGDGVRISLLRELLRRPSQRQHTLPALLVVALEGLLGRFQGGIAKWAAAGRQLQADLEAELGPHGVILHPPYSRAAPHHLRPLLTPLDFICTAIFNVLEFPVTQVPFGIDAQGLPLGVQVAARRGADHLTLAVAAALEADEGPFRRADPTGIGG